MIKVPVFGTDTPAKLARLLAEYPATEIVQVPQSGPGRNGRSQPTGVNRSEGPPRDLF